MKYDSTGIIPTREQLKARTLQTLIQKNIPTSETNGTDISDFLQFHVHWWGFEIKIWTWIN